MSNMMNYLIGRATGMQKRASASKNCANALRKVAESEVPRPQGQEKAPDWNKEVYEPLRTKQKASDSLIFNNIANNYDPNSLLLKGRFGVPYALNPTVLGDKMTPEQALTYAALNAPEKVSPIRQWLVERQAELSNFGDDLLGHAKSNPGGYAGSAGLGALGLGGLGALLDKKNRLRGGAVGAGLGLLSGPILKYLYDRYGEKE